MHPASTNISLFLGQHETTASGMWVYSFALSEALARSLANGSGAESSEIGRLHCVAGGGVEVQEALARLVETQPQMSYEFAASSGAARRLRIFWDALTAKPAGSLVHGTANTVPLRGKAKRVVTIHDLLQAYPRQETGSVYASLRGILYRWLFRMTCRRADLILTDHEQTREEIHERFRPPCRIEVVYPGLHPVFLEGESSQSTESLESPGDRHSILAFASSDPRKNIDRVVEAVEALQLPVDLTILASSESVRENLVGRLRSHSGSVKISVRTGVSSNVLLELYRSHDSLCFPSLAEGFGYPVYEALSQGTPVVTSSELIVKGLREQTAPMVFSCEPGLTESIRDAIGLVLAGEFPARERLEVSESVRGVLSFELAAKKILKLYAEISG